MPLRLLTFGPPTVRDGDLPVAGAAAQPRRLALLAMLARAGDRGLTRDKVIALLWPEEEEERARRNLTHAIYALRRDLGQDEAIVGTKDLRLNAEWLTADVDEFTRAHEAGAWARAAELYTGPFLDGFHLPASGEFERWADRERQILAEECRGVLETLATEAERAGDHATASKWWRRLAAQDPLDARIAVRLMRSLAGAGEPAAALRHARIYESLIAEELELPPDRAVMAYAEELRKNSSVPLPPPFPAPVAVPESVDLGAPAAPTPTRAGGRWEWFAMGVVAVLTLVLALLTTRARATTVLAVGGLTDHRPDSTDQSVGTIRDLLATNLARGQGLQVLSTSRLYEFIPAGAVADPPTLLRAARAAGATEVIDGALFRLPDGRLRLDLRRARLSDGRVQQALSVEGNDPFALVDTGTARMLDALGQAGPAGSIADVTTRSLPAYRLYEQGLRRFAAQDRIGAEPLFAAALAEDSSFALAAYYLALSTNGTNALFITRFQRARELARRVSDRDRLIIEVGWANTMSDPALGAIADSLRERYPTELLGHLYAGHARIAEGRFAEALGPFEYAYAHDSALAQTGSGGRCIACEAIQGRITAYTLLDSIPAALREVERWARLLPRDPIAPLVQADLLVRHGRLVPAFQALARAVQLDPARTDIPIIRARLLIHAGRLTEADSVLRAFLPRAAPRDRVEAFWNLALAQRELGNMSEALQFARRYRQGIQVYPEDGSSVSASAQLEAQMLLEAGRPRASAALFDSIAHVSLPSFTPSARARTLAWGTVHASDALAVAGDTALLALLPDSIERMSALSGFARDRRLHHHARGLLALARGDSAGAEGEFRAAVYSWTDGYTRTNLFLARLLAARGADQEARQILEAALRGSIDGSDLYVPRRDLRTLLDSLTRR